MKLISRFLEAPRPVKRLVSISYDSVAILLSLYLAWILRIGRFNVRADYNEFLCFGIVLVVTIFVFIRLGLYRAILRYMAHQAAITVLIGTVISSIVFATSSFYLNAFIPRSVPIIYLFTAVFFIAVPRMLIRNIVNSLRREKGERAIIYGAGRGGHQLAAALHGGGELRPVAFVDDNQKLHGSYVRGIRVYAPSRLPKLIRDHRVSNVLLALGNIKRQHRLGIVRSLETLPVKVKTVPTIAEIIHDHAKIAELRDIQIEDLLGRDPVLADDDLMAIDIQQKTVMITGAGGSIGSELTRQIILRNPSKVVLYDNNEFNLYRIEDDVQKMIEQHDLKLLVISLLGSVRDRRYTQKVMKEFSVDTVYHAAAYKHVPIVEHNLIEGIQNNLFGTRDCAQAAIAAGVKVFVMISTDKAVRPTNVMGASKRLAELTLQALAMDQDSTKFCIVRFGNVLGSSGSVVPRFRDQIQQGGPITITHPEVTRYFMTISEAAQLVIQAGAMSRGGEVFVLEMGEPVKILEMARDMVSLSGLTIRDTNSPDGDIEIVFTGLRPGEKLNEELLIESSCQGTDHKRIMRADESVLSWHDLKPTLDLLQQYCEEYDLKMLYETILHSPSAFEPSSGISDLIYHNESSRPSLVNLKD